MKLKLLFLLVLSTFCLKTWATEATMPTPEDQIPLKVADGDKTEDKSSGGQKVVYSLGIMVILAGVGYYLIRRYSHKSTPGKSNMQMKVLAQHYLGPKKSLAIVRVAGESILIGVTDHNISMIKSLSLLDEELPQVLPKEFSETLTEENADSDEFSFEGLQTTVTGKMKSMRSIANN